MAAFTEVEYKLNTYPCQLGKRLCAVRALILEISKTTQAIGTLEQSLKWEQISFATKNPKSGTPIRIDGNSEANTYSLYVPCSTNLINDFRALHSDMFDYRGNREIRMKLNKPMPIQELTLFLTAALTYYLR